MDVGTGLKAQQIRRISIPRPLELWDVNDAKFPVEKDEVSQLKYTPVLSVKPVNFNKDGYALRVLGYGREIKIMIIATMYNESADFLWTSLNGIHDNIKNLCTKDRDFWQRIIVCVVSDGRAKANKGTLQRLTELGLYSDTLIEENYVEDVTMHLFEATYQKHDADRKSGPYPPMQIMFCLKEHNAGKLNSHPFHLSEAPSLSPGNRWLCSICAIRMACPWLDSSSLM